VGSTLFFTASDGVNGNELWKSDGTAAGTVLVKDIFPGLSGPSPSSLTAVGNTLFFTANDGVNGNELWKSDGTAAGTVLVKDINPGSAPTPPPNL
jgi:ELWxxDGT repeat protein